MNGLSFKRLHRVFLKCDGCGCTFVRRPSDIRSEGLHFHSTACQQDYYRRVGMPAYKGADTIEDKVRQILLDMGRPSVVSRNNVLDRLNIDINRYNKSCVSEALKRCGYRKRSRTRTNSTWERIDE